MLVGEYHLHTSSFLVSSVCAKLDERSAIPLHLSAREE